MHDKLLVEKLHLFCFLRLEIFLLKCVKRNNNMIIAGSSPVKGLVFKPVRSEMLIINCSPCCKNQYVLKRFQAINNIFFWHEYI